MSNGKKINTQDTVKSRGGENIELTIYQGGGQAVIQEARLLQLQAGNNSVLLEGIPTTYQTGTLRVTSVAGKGKMKLGPADYQEANQDLNNVLCESVGSKVSVQLESQSGRVNTFHGTLIAVLGNVCAVKRDDNKRTLLVPFTQLELQDGLPENLSDTPSLVMNPQVEQSGEFTVGLLYEAHGFSWTPRYGVFYDDEKQVVTALDCTVTIVNQSGANFKDAVVKLMAGSNAGQHGGGGYLESAAPAAFSRASMSHDSVSAETVGTMKMYAMPERITLSKGKIPQCTLFSSENIPVKRTFVVTGNYRRAGVCEKLPVNVRLAFENSEAKKLGFAFPAGEVDIFQTDKSGKSQKTGTAGLGATAAGEDFKLTFGPSSDVKAESKLVKNWEDPKPELPAGPRPGTPEYTGDKGDAMAYAAAEAEALTAPRFSYQQREITINNYKDKPVEVLVSENFGHGELHVAPRNASFQSDGSQTQTALLTIPASGKLTLSYTVRFKLN